MIRDFQRKRKIRRVLYSRGALAALLLLLILVGKATVGVYIKERDSRRQLYRVEQELAALAAREEKLQGDIARLQTPEGVEQEIREQFQVAKPGERMVVLVEDTNSSPEEPLQERSLIGKFFDLFR